MMYFKVLVPYVYTYISNEFIFASYYVCFMFIYVFKVYTVVACNIKETFNEPLHLADYTSKVTFDYALPKIFTSIDVLPSKNQALCEYCTLKSKLKHC